MACPPTVTRLALEASENAFTVLQLPSFIFVPSDGGQPARGRELENRVLPQKAHGEMLSACTKTPSGTQRPEMLVAAASRSEGRACLLFGIIETKEFGARASVSQAEVC